MPGFDARTPFFGRAHELRHLQNAFDQSATGQGSLIFIVGEPGIGKTSISNQLAGYASERGGCVLTGRCHEPGSLSLPYLPFVEALGTYVRAEGPATVVQALGTEANELANMLPELRATLPTTSHAKLLVDPQDGQYRLLRAVDSLIGLACASRPLLIVLEDLQDADQSTLTLLLHLTHHVKSTRLLMVGTYRDVDVDRSHPLSGALAELRRIVPLDRLHLRGLTSDEVQQVLQSIAGQPVQSGLAEAVSLHTEGNPLFVQEVGRYLVEEGLVDHVSSQLLRVDEKSLDFSIPEGLREVIGKRLSRLSPECNRLLSVAAVIGREFRADTLQAVSEASDEDLATCLDDAVRAVVVEEAGMGRPGPARFRFAHAFFRQMLYEELIAPRRLRFHQQVARTLEGQFSEQLGEHSGELAEHFAQSTDEIDLAKAVRYGEMAAERALAVYAYGDAAKHLQQALEVQELLDPTDTAKRCDLLLAQGEALLPTGEVRRVAESIALEGLRLAESLGDQRRASRACQLALAGLVRRDHHLGVDTTRYLGWAEAADRWAAPDSLDRVHADLAMVSPRYFSDRLPEAWELLQKAMTLARTLNNGEALYQAAVRLFDLSWLPEHQEERRHTAEELFLHRREDVTERTLGRFLIDSSIIFLDWGMRTRAEQALREARVIADRTRDPWTLVLWFMHEAVLAAVDGNLEEVVQKGRNLRIRSIELDVPGPGELRSFLATLRPLLYLGRAEEALAGQPESSRITVEQGRSIVFGAENALCLSHLGRWSEAQHLLDRLSARWDPRRSTFNLSVGVLTSYLEAAVLARDAELTGKLRNCLSGLGSLCTEIYATCIARHLGAASALLGEGDAARRYYDQALEVAGKVGFRPEIALAHLGIAELQPNDCLVHLEFAIAEFREMKMQPAIARALQLAEQVARPAQQGQGEGYPDRLSPREIEVLRLLAEGRSNPEIAAKLIISLNTVTRHVNHIFAKTGAVNRVEAAMYAHRSGLT